MRPAAITGLASAIRGVVLTPHHPDFDATAGVVQLARPRHPALIVRPSDATDVARVIRFARDEGLEIAVRGGGHSAAAHGTGDGVLVLDMRCLRELAVNPDARRLRAGSGLVAGDVIAAAHQHGLTVPLGDSSGVGVAGITLGGGVGYLSRQHGLTVDHLVSADLVTADGRLVTASADAEPELFWAIRGGGGNFGVVTSLEFNMVEAGEVYGGALLLPASENVLRGIAPLAGAAPRELGVIANLMPGPRAPFVPPDMVGRPVVVLAGVYNGHPAAGEAAWAPFRSLARPIADTLGPMPFPAIYRLTAGAGRPSAWVSRSMFVEVLDDTVVDALRQAYATAPGTRAMVQVRILGGAVADRPGDSTAYAHRAAPVHITAQATASSAEALGPCKAWADDLLDNLRGRSIGAYVNYLEDEGEARIREAYPARTHRRLAAAKAVWDPDNVFHRNHNIRPAADGRPIRQR